MSHSSAPKTSSGTPGPSTQTKKKPVSKSEKDGEKEVKKRKAEEKEARKKTPSSSTLEKTKDKNIEEQKTREEAKQIASRYVVSEAEESSQESASGAAKSDSNHVSATQEIESEGSCDCVCCVHLSSKSS